MEIFILSYVAYCGIRFYLSAEFKSWSECLIIRKSTSYSGSVIINDIWVDNWVNYLMTYTIHINQKAGK